MEPSEFAKPNRPEVYTRVPPTASACIAEIPYPNGGIGIGFEKLHTQPIHPRVWEVPGSLKGGTHGLAQVGDQVFRRRVRHGQKAAVLAGQAAPLSGGEEFNLAVPLQDVNSRGIAGDQDAMIERTQRIANDLLQTEEIK